MIQWIFFDVGSTLVDETAAYDHRVRDMIAASAEIGYAKPDRLIFEKALEMAMCRAEKSMMVGDWLDNDIIPAKALGMKIVWVKNDLAQYQIVALGEGVADCQVNKLSELLCIL